MYAWLVCIVYMYTCKYIPMCDGSLRIYIIFALKYAMHLFVITFTLYGLCRKFSINYNTLLQHKVHNNNPPLCECRMSSFAWVEIYGCVLVFKGLLKWFVLYFCAWSVCITKMHKNRYLRFSNADPINYLKHKVWLLPFNTF